MDFSGILLAGGKSRRIGPNKIRIMAGDVPLLIEQVLKLGFFASEIIICTSSENKAYISHTLKNLNKYVNILKISRKYNRQAIKVKIDDNLITDNTRSIGPIAGIYTGLKNSSHSYGLVLAADMPFISFKLLKLLTDRAHEANRPDAVIIRNRKGIEALCGIYSRKCIKIIEKSIISGVYKISDILKDLAVVWIEPEELQREKIDMYNFFNINLPEDIKEYNKILDKGVSSNGANNIRSGTVQKWKDNFFRGTGKGTYQQKI